MKRLRSLIIGDRAINALALALALLIPSTLWMTAWRVAIAESEREARTRFELYAASLRETIIQRLAGYEQSLRGAAGLFAASAHIGRDEWRNYYEYMRISEMLPGIRALGYSPRIPAAGAEAFVARMRTSGLTQYAIVPQGARAEYAPMVYIEPYSQDNLQRLGRDLLADSGARTIIEDAITTGNIAVSAVSVPAPSGEAPARMLPGVLIVVPVYANSLDIETAQQRRHAVQGYVSGLFGAQELFDALLAGEDQVAVTIHSALGPDAHTRLYGAAKSLQGRTTPRHSVEAPVQIRTQTWQVRADSTEAFEAITDHERPRLILLGGVALHLLLLGVLWAVWATRTRAVRLARSMVREVRRREAEWQAMNDASPLGVFRADAAGNVVYVNRRYVLLAGWPADALSGRGWFEIVEQQDRDRVAEAWGRFVAERRSEFTETCRLRRPDGTLIWVTASVAMISGEDARGGYVGLIDDITARKHATEALVENRERLGLALDGSNLALFDWDIAGGAVRLSEHWQVMLGGARAETLTTIEALQASVHRDDLPRLQQSLRAVLKGESPHYEVQHRVRDLRGQWRWVHSRGKVTERAADGRALRLIGTNADITAGKEVERLKNEFVATISHELRTPLTAIIGSLSLIRDLDENLDPQAAGFVDMALQNSERLAALVNDVLDFEKIESGQMTIDLRPLQLREVLERAVRINQPYAGLHQVRLQLLPGPDACVAANADRLMQVLTNLISNAAKFSPPRSGVEVNLLLKDDAVRVEVRDHGPGIPENFRSQIFGRFERADNSNTRRKGGTGLGLAISKGLIEHMNGSIGFDSAEGEGSTFYFELPLARQAVAGRE